MNLRSENCKAKLNVNTEANHDVCWFEVITCYFNLTNQVCSFNYIVQMFGHISTTKEINRF